MLVVGECIALTRDKRDTTDGDAGGVPAQNRQLPSRLFISACILYHMTVIIQPNRTLTDSACYSSLQGA